jgi:hypothetical protein
MCRCGFSRRSDDVRCTTATAPVFAPGPSSWAARAAYNASTVSTTIRVRRPSNAPSWARRRLHENGNVNTHWRSPLCGGSTPSIRFAAMALIRRPRHDGQKPRPLQLNATSRFSPHPSHFSRAKPRQRSPQSRYAPSSLRACLGMRTAIAPSSIAPYSVSRLSRTTSYSTVVSGRWRR